MTKHAGGRPKEGERVKLAPLNMRTDPALKALIVAAAEETGRSHTQEVERRLRTSFIFDDARGGPHIGAFANMLCSAIQMIELRTGRKWTEDTGTFEAVQVATERLLRWTRPPAPEDDELLEAAKRSEEAAQAHAAARAELDSFRQAHGLPSFHGIAMDSPQLHRRGGLFGSGPVWVDARAHWSDEDKAEEERLMAVEQAAGEVATAASDAVMRLLQPGRERRTEAKRLGLDTADPLFAQFGPKPKKG